VKRDRRIHCQRIANTPVLGTMWFCTLERRREKEAKLSRRSCGHDKTTAKVGKLAVKDKWSRRRILSFKAQASTVDLVTGASLLVTMRIVGTIDNGVTKETHETVPLRSFLYGDNNSGLKSEFGGVVEELNSHDS
jgi:hypothetical protein